MESMDHARDQDLSRQLIEELERLAAADNIIPALPGKRRETVRRTMPPKAAPVSRLENAIPEPRRWSPDSPATIEPLTPLRAIRRRGRLLGHTVRVVAAIGVSALIAQLFVIMMPAARQPNKTQVFAAAVQSLAARSQRHRGEDAARPALAALQPQHASDGAARAAGAGQKPSDRVLQRFLQWRQKTNPGEAAR